MGVGLSGCRTTGPSDYRAVGLLGRHPTGCELEYKLTVNFNLTSQRHILWPNKNEADAT